MIGITLMAEISRKIFIVCPPVDRPDLCRAFDLLASKDGWQQVFNATDRDTGKSVLVVFEPASEAA